MVSYPSYKQFRAAKLRCQQCNWSGQGRETEFRETEIGGSLTQYHCPNCGEPLANAPSPRVGDDQR
jgi:predicted RNA-binding Zn-ribbon protein involved in translation (DUF1610 family)